MPLTISRPAALAAAAACFCSSPAFQRAQITYLLAVLAGGSTDPKALAFAARCWNCVSERMLLADQVYLLSVLAGGSQVPSTLSSQSACYCFSWDVMWSVRVQALAVAAGITNPNTVANGAVQFTAVGYPQGAVQTYLLAGLAGGSTNPSTIGAAAIQFSGLTAQALQQIWTVLAVAWAGVPVTPPVTPPAPSSIVILPDGAGGFWRVIIDVLGDVGTQSDPGPQTPDVILSDGGGGFWKLIADTQGNRMGQTNAGPATVPPVLLDANLVAWTLVTDSLGDIGATS